MSIELDGMVGLGQLEEAALAFAREAPAQLVADGIESRRIRAPGKALLTGRR